MPEPYRPLKVDPTKNYPFPTDKEFINGTWDQMQRKAELESLQKEHDDLLAQLYAQGADGDDITAAFEDNQGHDPYSDEELLAHPGILELPTLELGQSPGTGVIDEDGKYYIIPIDENGQHIPVGKGQHFGSFNSLQSALDFEKQFIP